MNRLVVDRVSKRFRIGFMKNQSALSRVLSVFSGKEPTKQFWALKEVSFSVRAGEVVGLIGENGAGKSTLLRIISGIYPKDKGRVVTKGRLVPIIALGFGFQDRLTLKDNVYLFSSLLGQSREDIRNEMGNIVEFAELRDFVNTKLYQFSDGMKHRLAFSIAISCKPKVLLLDEVFEIGDKDFRRKSSEKIMAMVKTGTTVVLVSHELDMIKRHCSRVIWLKEGRVHMDGPMGTVLDAYAKDSPRGPRNVFKDQA